MRYHFDVIEESVLVDDDEGVEFADIETMQHEAMRAAGTMVSEKMSFPHEPWTMVVRDEKKAIVATLTFAVR